MADADLASLLARDFIEGDVFADVDGKDAVVEGRELYRCTFRGGSFAGARFSRVVFEQCVFEDCDLTRMTLPQSALRGVRFVRCKLMGVHFAAAADHPEVAFDDCDLRYAVFDGQALRGTRFVGCGLQDSSFNDVNLVDADFAGSDLDRATIARCDLAGADFASATGVFIDPAKNKAKDAMIGVDAAVAIVRQLGLRVDGYDDRRKAGATKKRR
ncbi:MAG TPA: pentapeptide repeat-containing protein [Myxococcota bacterium]